MQLTDDTRDGKTGGVGMETNRKIGVKVTKDWSSCKMTFEFLKGFLSSRGPVKLLVLMEKCRNGAGYARISFNKATIKISKAQKDLDVLNGGGNWPFRNGDDTIRFHRNAVGRDDETKEGDGTNVKLTLAKLSSQAIFSEMG